MLSNIVLLINLLVLSKWLHAISVCKLVLFFSYNIFLSINYLSEFGKQSALYISWCDFHSLLITIKLKLKYFPHL